MHKIRDEYEARLGDAERRIADAKRMIRCGLRSPVTIVAWAKDALAALDGDGGEG